MVLGVYAGQRWAKAEYSALPAAALRAAIASTIFAIPMSVVVVYFLINVIFNARMELGWFFVLLEVGVGVFAVGVEVFGIYRCFSVITPLRVAEADAGNEIG